MGFFSDLLPTFRDVSSFRLDCLELSFKKLVYFLQTSVLGTLLGLVHGLDLPYVGIVHFISEYKVHDNIPYAKTKAGIGIKCLLWQIEPCTCSSSHKKLPCPLLSYKLPLK